MKLTELSYRDKLLLLKWMDTKPHFQAMITRYGAKKTLAYYLKDKSKERMLHILFHLGRMAKNNFKVKRKHPASQLKYPTGIVYARGVT